MHNVIQNSRVTYLLIGCLLMSGLALAPAQPPSSPSRGPANGPSTSGDEPARVPDRASPSWADQEYPPQRPPTRVNDAPALGPRTFDARIPLVERAPKTIYVPTKDGELVPFYNIPLSRIQRLLDLEAGVNAAQAPPTFQVDQLVITGTADKQMAKLEVEIDVVLLPDPNRSESRWTLIPIRFHDASLLDSPVYEGDGQLYLTFDVNEGYQGWLKHDRPGKHKIRMQLGVALTRPSDAVQMRFFPPLANRSKLDLQVSGKGVLADLENGRNLSITEGADGKARLIADDLRNQVVATWREGGQLEAERPTYLDVRGDIRVQIDGPGVVRSNVALDVQGYGGLIEEFAIRLPPNTTIVSGDQPGYSLRERSDDVQENRALVQVKLDQPATQARFQFTTQTTEAAAGQSILNVGNIEVVGAIRQSGRVSLLTGEEWLVFWKLGPSVRRVQNIDTVETSQQRRLLASFEYFRQPCRLSVQVEPQGTRVDVQPTYRVRVEEDSVRLDAELDYNVRGAQVSFLNVALNGWSLVDIGPAGAVENDDFNEDEVDEILLRLTNASSGNFTLTLQLDLPLEKREGRLRIPLPRPAADSVSAGAVWVESAESVMIDFRIPEMPGLVQDRALARRFVSEREITSTDAPSDLGAAFRLVGDDVMGDIVCDYEVRDQETSIRVDSSLELSLDRAQVVQDIAYRVRFKPATQITLDVPQELFELLLNPRFRSLVSLELDGQSLGTDWYQDSIDLTNDLRPLVPVTIALDEARRGNFTIRLTYPWSLQTGTTGDSRVPLVVPRGGDVLANVVILNPVGGLRVEPANDGNWEREDDLVAGNLFQSVGLKSPRKRADEVRLSVVPLREDLRDTAPLTGTIVERAWHQTWLSHKRRMDRCVFQLSTAADSITVTLPPRIEQTRVFVDGVAANDANISDDQVVIPLASGTEHTVELVTSYPSRNRIGEMEFAMPEIVDANDRFRWFWQLLLPDDEHLLVSDTSLTSANRWVRRGWLWSRTSLEVSDELEHWTNATIQPPLPAGLNRYLFSSFERADSFKVRTISRSALVNTASLTLLAVGLALIYVPLMRHPTTLLLLAVMLFAGASMNSDAFVVIAQACLFGLALCFLAAATWAAVRTAERIRISKRLVGSSITRSNKDSNSGQVAAWRELGAPHTTITAPPTSLPSPVSDSKS